MPVTAQQRVPRKGPRAKQALVMDTHDDPAQWLGFSLPPRAPAPTHHLGVPRRSKRGDAWRGSVLTREKFVNANFRFMLKPTELASYGAHFADPDISLHWPHILQILVPTFSSFSVAQGFVSENAVEDDEAGEEAAERRRRIEEEKQGRTCPICLSKPVAGRMTKCGHIFCFPCILHFIQLSDIPKAASCPICGDTIHEGMLKSVKYLDAETMVKAASGDGGGTPPSTELDRVIDEAKIIDSAPSTAHRLHMRLLQRPQMTTLALPPTPTWPSDAVPPLMAPWYFLPDVLTYSHFMVATPEYMLAELQRERRELDAEWRLLEGDDLGRTFVAAAQAKVDRQVGKVTSELMTALVGRNEAESRVAWGDAVGKRNREIERRLERELRAREHEEKERHAEEDKQEVPVEFLATTGGYQYNTPTVHVPANKVVPPNPMPSTTGKRNKRRPGGSTAVPATPPAAAYFFYQSSLGANVFLSPLDSRILLAHFQSYADCPPSITFSTTGYDSATVSDELRRRVKYLSHLPVGAEVVFVEADLSGLVSKEVLAQFDQPLKARRAKRRERVKREDRDKRRAEQAERTEHPPDVHIVPSALVMGSNDPDHELALALAHSRLDGGMSIPAEVGAAFPLPSGPTGTSPTHSVARSPPSGASFAWAVHSRATTSNPIRRPDNVEGVEEAWSGLNLDDEEPAEGKKKKGGKKGKKLVLGGGGRRA